MKKIFPIALFILLSFPSLSFGQTYNEIRNFCKISQMLMPIFLRSGNFSGEAVCIAGTASTGSSYLCNSEMGLGAGICAAGTASTGSSFLCNSEMSLGAGICAAGTASTRSSYLCNSQMSLGEAICSSGGRASYDCTGIGDNDLGIGICLALGGNRNQCANVSVSEAICSFTGNCTGYDAAALVVSMVKICGTQVLSYGIK